MSRILRNLKSFSGALLSLTVLLIALMFVLNYLAARGLGPLSSAAAWTQNHITPGANVVVGSPSVAPLSPNDYHSF